MSERLARVTLDDGGRARSMEAEHERSVALADLMGANLFAPAGMECGPYDLALKVEDGRLAFDIFSPSADKHVKLALSVQPLKSLIRDYFLVCESYYAALKDKGASKIEAIDMGRRGLHNEGAEILKNLLEGKVTVDFQTSRRLFTLICVLHIK